MSPEAGNAIATYLRTTFSSLRLHNYRMYFIGQSISMIGTWMQSIAEGWLVADLTGSATMVGLVVASQFLPVLLLAPYGGVIADRFPKRRILLVTQTVAALLAFTLAALTATGAIQLWMLFVLATGLGLVNAVDNPTRQALVHELVGPDDLRNAVTLNGMLVNMMRIIGPALAGVVIVTIGMPLCFAVNGASFLVVIVFVLLMRSAEMTPVHRLGSTSGQLSAGLSYAWRTPIVRDVLIMMAIAGCFTFEFPTTLTNLTKFTFGTTAMGPASLMSAMGVGATLGGLLTAGRRTSAIRGLVVASFGFGLTTLLVSVSPSMFWAGVGMFAVGAFSIMFTSLTNTILQTESLPQMRGRVMALWTVGFFGMTAIGAPVVGWVGETFNPRWSLALGGMAALAAGFIGLRALRRDAHEASDSAVVLQPANAEKEDFR